MQQVKQTRHPALESLTADGADVHFNSHELANTIVWIRPVQCLAIPYATYSHRPLSLTDDRGQMEG